MDAWAKSRLVAAVLYVIAVATLATGLRPEIPAGVVLSLELRQLETISRLARPATDVDWPNPGAGAVDELAGWRVPADDRVRAAALAIAFRAPQAVPLLAGPVAGREPAARVLTAWALDPGFPATRADLAVLRSAGLSDYLADVAVAAVARTAGLEPEAAEAGARVESARETAVAIAGALGFAGLAVLATGSLLWFRVRRRPGTLQAPSRPATFLPLVQVFAYFAAVWLTTGLVVPRLADDLGLGGEGPLLAAGIYALNGAVVLWLVRRRGDPAPGEGLADQLGLSGSFRLRGLPRALAWAAAGYCMIWPVFLGAALLTPPVVGGGDAMGDPLTLLLVTETGTAPTALLLVLLGVAAPLLEEAVFRGFLYRRLRTRLGPAGAAALSAVVFAAAHGSLAQFLPVAAIGFALAVAYERTGDLATPVLAHSAWNLLYAASLVAMYR